MFFSTYILTKKGPLAKVWLAAHWDKKLTKNEVRVVDLSQTVLSIVKPSVPIALRTSGELMLGVVRIYALKVKHVQKDASDAITYLLRPKLVGAGQVLSGKGAIEGVKGKEAAVGAVTMDLVVGRAGVDQLCEADFTDIADILAPSGAAKKPADEPAGGAWFAAEPSQFLEESRMLTQDDITLMKADLAEFDKQMQQQRDPSSGTSSKTKSSLSSVEAARQGAAVDPLAMGLDIGAPMPEDDLMNLAAPGASQLAAPELEDPFALGEMPRPSGQQEEDAEAAAAPKRRVKILNILDTKDTMLSREQLQKMQTNTGDILCPERRHGPLDEDEILNRHTLRNAETSVNDCAPLANLPNVGLRAVFESAMRTTVEKAVENMEAARASHGGADARNSKKLLPEDDAMGPPAELPPMDDLLFEYQAEEPQQRPSGRKRVRETEDKGEAGFSASTIATLERLRGTLTKNTSSISFDALTKGKKRAETARTFVDMLVLASHRRVEVAQRDPYGQIVISKTDKLGEAVASQ